MLPNEDNANTCHQFIIFGCNGKNGNKNQEIDFDADY